MFSCDSSFKNNSELNFVVVFLLCRDFLILPQLFCFAVSFVILLQLFSFAVAYLLCHGFFILPQLFCFAVTFFILPKLFLLCCGFFYFPWFIYFTVAFFVLAWLFYSFPYDSSPILINGELRDSVSLLLGILQADWSSSEPEKKIFVNHWNNS